MNRNIILAIALSFLVMIVWAKFTQKLYPVDTQGVTEKTPMAESEPLPPLAVPEIQQEETLVSAISHDRELVFSLPSACLKSINFHQFGDFIFNLDQGLCLAQSDLDFSLEKITSEEAIFIHQDKDKIITKQFNYSDPHFVIILDIKFENLSEQYLTIAPHFIAGKVDLVSRDYANRLREVFVKQSNQIKRVNNLKKEHSMQYSGDFFGFRDSYASTVIIPETFSNTIKIVPSDATDRAFGKGYTKSMLVLLQPNSNLPPNQIDNFAYKCYIGPQKAELLRLFSSGAEQIIYYGKLDFFAKLFLKFLRFVYGLVHNWGVAIIIFSTLMFFALFPLSLKSMRSMKEMQKLNPQIEDLRKRYKDNPQRLQKEQLALWRKNKVNPMGGCLPTFLQFPIFIGFFLVLTRLLDLKGANFLWIQDLSQPDRLIKSPEINILPILMALVMFLQQKSSTIHTSGSTAEQQRMMGFILPVIFGIFFYRMPSGLVLYWFMNSLLMYIFHMRLIPATGRQ